MVRGCLAYTRRRNHRTPADHQASPGTTYIDAFANTGVVSAPLYDSSNYRFAGMFTLVDVIHLIQYYYLTATGYDNAALEVEQVDLSALRGSCPSPDFSFIIMVADTVL